MPVKGNAQNAATLAVTNRRDSGHEIIRFDQLVAELTAAFVRATTDQIDNEINRWLERIVLDLNLDRSTIAQIDPATGVAHFSHGWAREQDRIIGRELDPNALLPWLKRQVMAGETVVFSNLDELPEEAAVDRESMEIYGPKSNVTLPIKFSGAVVGAVGFGALYHERKWPPQIVEGLRLIADVLGYALERKRTVTEMLKMRAELAHVSRITTMGQLAASLAHELNQPLAAILNNAQAIQRMLDAVQPDLKEIRAALEDIVQDDQRAAGTIRSFRNLFSGGQPQKSIVELSRVLDELARVLGADAVIRNVALRFECQPALPTVAADRIQLEQALINLVLNAFDAVHEDPAGPRQVVVNAYQSEPRWVTVAVRDSGPGLNPKIGQQIFQPFFTTKRDGLGMGLAIARSIAEAHHGHLRAAQNPGRGATFELAIPAA